MELWKRPDKYPDYEVSDLGRVRSWKTFHKTQEVPFYLKPIKDAYPKVKMAGENVGLHRLVLETFVGPCPEGMEACHNNGDKQDYKLSNLRWDTRTNNALDKRRHGTLLKGETHGMSKLTDNKVRVIRSMYADAEKTQKQLAEFFGIDRTNVSSIIRKETWSHVN